MKAKKYPKMCHLPWSEEIDRDDKRIGSTMDCLFYNSSVVITEKVDGSNVCLTGDNLFARSHGHEPKHKSFDMLKQRYHQGIKRAIPSGLAFYGEWLYAVHSIKYTSLPDYLLIFMVLDMNRDVFLSWEDTVDHAQELSLKTVPVLYEGAWKDEIIDMTPYGDSMCGGEREGMVIRYAWEFGFDGFGLAVGKVVRKGHVTTDEHWRSKPIKRNVLRAVR